MGHHILVINTGSSSIKFSVFESAQGQGLECVLEGVIEGIGLGAGDRWVEMVSDAVSSLGRIACGLLGSNSPAPLDARPGDSAADGLSLQASQDLSHPYPRKIRSWQNVARGVDKAERIKGNCVGLFRQPDWAGKISSFVDRGIHQGLL